MEVLEFLFMTNFMRDGAILMSFLVGVTVCIGVIVKYWKSDNNGK